MSEQEIYERLNEVFRNVFDDDDIEVEAGTTADDIEDWDSLEHINLISAVEDEFGIRFKMGEVSSMKNVGEMVDIIKSRAWACVRLWAASNSAFGIVAVQLKLVERRD